MICYITNMIAFKTLNNDVGIWYVDSYNFLITVTSWWARCRLNWITVPSIVGSNAYWSADQRNTEILRHWPLWGKPPVTDGFPSQRANNKENVPFWWRHHVVQTHWINPHGKRDWCFLNEHTRGSQCLISSLLRNDTYLLKLSLNDVYIRYICS